MLIENSMIFFFGRRDFHSLSNMSMQILKLNIATFVGEKEPLSNFSFFFFF